MRRAPEDYSKLYERAMGLQKEHENKKAEYDWQKYRCQLEGCVVKLDLPDLPRNEQIFRFCPECNRRTFMRLVRV